MHFAASDFQGPDLRQLGPFSMLTQPLGGQSGQGLFLNPFMFMPPLAHEKCYVVLRLTTCLSLTTEAACKARERDGTSGATLRTRGLSTAR